MSGDCAFAAELFKKTGMNQTGHYFRCAGCAVAALERLQKMNREVAIRLIEKQKTILQLVEGKGIRSPIITDNAHETIEELQKLVELPMHPDPEINKEVNADIRAGEEADKAAGLPLQDFDKEVEQRQFENLLATWTPTSENINALPDPLRQFIMELETRCDPAGDTAKLTLQKDTIAGLETKVVDLQEALDDKINQHNNLILGIKKHHDQTGDDRCWLDDVELYGSAGLDDGNSALPELREFIGNCIRFHQSRQNPESKYLTVAEQVDKAIIKTHPLYKQSARLLERVAVYHRNAKGKSRELVEDVKKLLKKMEKASGSESKAA